MKELKQRVLIYVLILTLTVTVGCSRSHNAAPQQVDAVTVSLNEIEIPDHVKIIGFGEATHGNSELQALKKQLFEGLIMSENVFTFILEADFGGALQINRYIHDGIGTAKEALEALDYNIYKTEEMLSLVEWMYEYNLEAEAEKRIYFYGNDMQRYDYNKQGLLQFYDYANKEAASNFTTQLSHLSNATMRDMSVTQLNETNNVIEMIISDLQDNRVLYIEATTELDYEYAMQYAKLMQQRTALFLNEANYTDLRDQYLAENLQWIVEMEALHGRDKVFVSAHNGHIEKTSASLAGYKSMGHYLAEKYGTDYYAIGTDVIESEFLSRKGESTERAIFKVKNSSELVTAFKNVPTNIFYVDFERMRASSELEPLVSKKQNMVNIGDGFNKGYNLVKQMYTISMIPQEAYDGLIIIKHATPTTMYK